MGHAGHFLHHEHCESGDLDWLRPNSVSRDELIRRDSRLGEPFVANLHDGLRAGCVPGIIRYGRLRLPPRPPVRLHPQPRWRGASMQLAAWARRFFCDPSHVWASALRIVAALLHEHATEDRCGLVSRLPAGVGRHNRLSVDHDRGRFRLPFCRLRSAKHALHPPRFVHTGGCSCLARVRGASAQAPQPRGRAQPQRGSVQRRT
mmetsp:Transcript_8750/g.22629  ORF Transcript_8750/g.22629 Transcript_8750/m.22629 type:complete len:204 (-) Transcript_8750:978-1589(-)